MKAWCDHQGLQESDALFEYKGRVLKPEDTPAMCGFTAFDGIMKINAKPRDEAAESSGSKPAETAATTQGTGSDEKVAIQVIAQEEKGENIIDFKMKATAPFDKMMKAWLKHQGLQESDALFEYNGRVLKAEDTPAMCGFSAADGIMKIDAKPRDAAESAAPRQNDGSPTTAAGSAEEKVSMQVVAQAEGGENIVDFKMKAASPFDKMMKAWCKHQGLKESNVIFEYNGRVLKPTDSPASCGFAVSDGIKKITAKPYVQPAAPKASTRPETSVAAKKAPKAKARSKKTVDSAVPMPTFPTDEKVSVQVVAEAEGGENIVDFKMKASSPFDKMMKAWCKHQGLQESDALFEYNGRVLKAEDTPATCNFAASHGIMKINAKPREEAAESSASKPAETATATAIEPTQDDGSPMSATAAETIPASLPDEKVSVQVVAQAEGGENVVDFKMKASSPFDKMMKAWCKHQGLQESDALFEYNGRELKAEDTPATCNFAASHGIMKINAKPREEAAESSASKPAETAAATAIEPTQDDGSPMSATAAETIPASLPDEKVSVQVVAQAEGGENVVDFKMKASSPFDKMMKAWCKHQGLQESDALFEYNGRELKAEDTPATCNFAASHGIMKINAKPREEVAESGASKPAETAAATAIEPTQDDGSLMSATAAETIPASLPDEKVSVQVVAQAEGGENVVDFKMKASSPFDKMMKAWCKHQGLQESDALFEYNGRELKAEDTPATCNFAASHGIMKINAKPREEVAESSASKPAETAAATAIEPTQDDGSLMSATAAETIPASLPDEKVSVQVVAEAEGGENIVDFKMKASSPFDKMMKAWCKHQGLQESDALFEYNGRELKAEDTPATCNFAASHGIMKINAKPREEVAESSASKPAETAAATAIEPTQDDGSLMSATAAETIPASLPDEKVSVQVVAQAEGGENVVDFKMKASSPFDKMMKAWCKHQGLQESDALFEYNGRELKAEDTPATCGFAAFDGIMKINANPNLHASAMSATIPATQGEASVHEAAAGEVDVPAATW